MQQSAWQKKYDVQWWTEISVHACQGWVTLSHCSSASLCTWRSPAPHPLHTPRRASPPRTPSRSCLHVSQPPKSTSSWSQTARTLALTPHHSTFHHHVTRPHLEYPETITKIDILTSPAMHVLRPFYSCSVLWKQQKLENSNFCQW